MRPVHKLFGRLSGGLSRFRREYFGTKQDIAWNLLGLAAGIGAGALFSALWIR